MSTSAFWSEGKAEEASVGEQIDRHLLALQNARTSATIKVHSAEVHRLAKKATEACDRTLERVREGRAGS